jgi:chromosome segregation ATPase
MKYLPPNWRMLLLIVGMSTAFIFAFTSNNSRLNAKIAELEGQNTILKESNDSLSKERVAIIDSIERYEIEIEHLLEIENAVLQQRDELENKIKNIKPKYEKANNHAANYTTDSISRYFSDLK